MSERAHVAKPAVHAPREAGTAANASTGAGPREALRLPSAEDRRADFRASVARRNETGLPDRLKAGLETLSGFSLDDVKVHYGSPKPAALQAHAYAQGTAIHVAPGGERHLPHEAWHVVQQKQGRVRATTQFKGVGVNDDSGLEREADAMGARAAGLAPSAGPRPAWAPPSAQPGGEAAPVQRAITSGEDQATIDERLSRLSEVARELFIEIRQVDSYTLDEAIALAEDMETLSAAQRNLCFEWRADATRSLRGAIDRFRRESSEMADTDESQGEAERSLGQPDENAPAEWGGDDSGEAGRDEDEESRGSGERNSSLASRAAERPDRDSIPQEEKSDEDESDEAAIPPEIAAELDGFMILVPGRPLRGRAAPDTLQDLGSYLREMNRPRRGRAPERRQTILEQVTRRWTAESAESDPDLPLVAALHWAMGQLAFSPAGSGRGAGSLKVAFDEKSQLTITGRPAWEPHVDETLGRPAASQHRRHIIAWHTIRRAIENVINRLLATAPDMKEQVVEGLNGFLDSFGGEEDMGDEGDGAADEDPLIAVLPRALSMLNSNVGNLWLGEGYENSLINTFQTMLRLWADRVDAEAGADGDEAAIEDLKARIAAFGARSSSSASSTYRAVSASIIEFLNGRISSSGQRAAEAADILREAADQFEVDYHFLFSGRRREPGPRITGEILRLAGRLLDWADSDEPHSDEREASGSESEGLLDEFMAALDGFMSVGTYAAEESDDSGGSADGRSSIEVRQDEDGGGEAAIELRQDGENETGPVDAASEKAKPTAPEGKKRGRSEDSKEQGSSEDSKEQGKSLRRPVAPALIPDEIEGAGSIENVSGRGMDCLIRAVLRSAGYRPGPGFEPQVDLVRDFLVEKHVVERGDMLDATGPSGQVMMQALRDNGLLNGRNGLIVHFRNPATGLRGREIVVDGGAPINIWFSAAHFRAIIPHG